LARDISAELIDHIPLSDMDLRGSPEYDEAVEAGALYWASVISGRPDLAAKEAADRALSRLIGCKVSISGRKQAWKDKILRAFS
jgi:hypothetical protein